MLAQVSFSSVPPLSDKRHFFYLNLLHIPTIGLYLVVYRNGPCWIFIESDTSILYNVTSIFERVRHETLVTMKIFLSKMAKQQLYHQTNATKRPSSLFGNAASGQVDYDLPYSHYAIIFVDNEGELNVDSSPSVRDQISSVITFKACQNFLTTLGRNYDFRDPYASGMLLVIPGRR